MQVGLRQLHDSAMRIATDTAKPQALRDEACGTIKTVEILQGLGEEIANLHKLVDKE